MTDAPVIVLFDADGVVQSSPADVWDRLGALLPEHVEREAFLSDLFAAELPTLTGEGDFLAAVAATLQAWRCPPAAAPDLAALWRLLEVDAGVVSVIGALRATGVRCYLATNQHAYRAAYMRAELGYEAVFDGQFYSCELGLAKPQAAYFEHILAVTGVPTHSALFLDDSERNVLGARTVGLRAGLFDRAMGVDALHALLSGHGLVAG